MYMYVCTSDCVRASGTRTRVCIGQVLRWNSYISSSVFFLFFFFIFCFTVVPLWFWFTYRFIGLRAPGTLLPVCPSLCFLFFPFFLSFCRSFHPPTPPPPPLPCVSAFSTGGVRSPLIFVVPGAGRCRRNARERGSKRDCLIALFSRSIALVSLNIFSFAGAKRMGETIGGNHCFLRAPPRGDGDKCIQDRLG